MSELLDHRYRVVRVLGAGGFGETFLAEDTKMPSRRLCVIKQLKQMTHNPEVYQIAKDRFYREAVVLEELGDASDRIPKLYGHFEEGERFYLVQEWIEGQTLQQKIEAEGTISETETRQILVSILQALALVHDRGIIHRDLKPENIIIRDRDRQTVLIDFGAVKEIIGAAGTALNTNNNSVSIVIGTPGYMPSEQAAGRPFFASDVYSLGLTAIYMLTGRQPAQLDHDPRTDEIEWRSLCPHISGELAHVIDKASRFHPRDRYGNASEMLRAMQTPSQPVAVTINMSAPNPPNTPIPIAAPDPANPSNLPTVQAAPPASYAPTTMARPSRRDPEQSDRRSTVDAFIVIGLVLACIAGVVGIGYYVVDAIANRTIDPNLPITPTPTTPPVDPLATDPDGFTEPDEFYFLADSAYRDAENAQRRFEQLRSQGYENAGTFWVPDYANLNGVEYIQVYVDRYDEVGDRGDCRNLLATHGQTIEDAYCALASKNADADIERILASEVLPKPDPTAAVDPQDAVRDYYDLINIREYDLAQDRLSKDFKEGALYGNEEQFLGWWNSVDRVVVTGTRTTRQSPKKATVETQLIYYMKDGSNSPESLRIKLVWDKKMEWWLFDQTERF
ncbi:serine/threonine protein kinase [Thalassoporum mexicanum PCC 7367]|uniref:serine/threonine-protein kinase n=1 Tax=Thalassoporum mexicanum TaxID=3457544 RepID=UPI00029FCD95|nr:serine/threonine-protein kinase [Pseudanabaena sp. PCC 7367]AFY68897.1 serine/threonine protein kinase [Pseudanabaena sp. PCC 7367]